MSPCSFRVLGLHLLFPHVFFFQKYVSSLHFVLRYAISQCCNITMPYPRKDRKHCLDSGPPHANHYQGLRPRARCGALTIAAWTTSPGTTAGLAAAPPLCRPPCAHPHESGRLRAAPMEWRRTQKKCTMRTCIRFPAKRRRPMHRKPGSCPSRCPQRQGQPLGK